MRIERRAVAHFVSSYLPLTCSWIYNQIRYTTEWQPVVLSYRTENLCLFPFDVIHTRQSLSLVAQIYQQGMRRIRGYEPFFKYVIQREDINVLHAHFGQTGYSCIPLAKACGIPLVTTFYGFDLSRLPQTKPEWQQRYWTLFAHGALFLVEGPYMKEQLVRLGCPSDKIRVQRLGIDLDTLQFRFRQPEPDGTIRVLAAGTFTEKKGMVYALEAFARVFQRHKNLRLTIIGDARANYPDEQEIKRKLLAIVGDNQLDDCVEFKGYQPHPVLVEAFFTHHLLLAPSMQAEDGDNEGGSPVTITEAAATGMPVLSTWHCDIPEVVLDQKTGFLVGERDVDALAERLEYLVTHWTEWGQMGEAGRRHIEEHFDARRQARLLEQHYASVIIS